MKNLSYTRSLVDKFAIKGQLSNDGKSITYINENKDPVEMSIEKCVAPFAGEFIDFTITVKSTEDLNEEDES